MKNSLKKNPEPENHISPALKKMKFTEDEYIEKLLLDFGYDNDGYNTVSKSDKKALPIKDERILIKLSNPKVKIERDFSPIRGITEMEIIPPILPVTENNNNHINTDINANVNSQNGNQTLTITETNKSGPSSQTLTQEFPKKIVDLSFLQGEISAKNKRNLIVFFIPLKICRDASITTISGFKSIKRRKSNSL